MVGPAVLPLQHPSPVRIVMTVRPPYKHQNILITPTFRNSARCQATRRRLKHPRDLRLHLVAFFYQTTALRLACRTRPSMRFRIRLQLSRRSRMSQGRGPEARRARRTRPQGLVCRGVRRTRHQHHRHGMAATRQIGRDCSCCSGPGFSERPEIFWRYIQPHFSFYERNYILELALELGAFISFKQVFGRLLRIGRTGLAGRMATAFDGWEE